MSDYTYQDMMRMQSEAKQRVLEMQKRSKSAAESFNGHSRAEKIDTLSPQQELPRVPKAISYPADLKGSQARAALSHHQTRERHNPLTDIRGALQSVFGNLSEDDYEKMLIMALCLLLSEEQKDDSLIYALMYLLT